MQSLPDELEDLVQETRLAIHLQRGTYDAAVPVSRWALAIARHKLIDLCRRRGRREALHDPLDELAERDQPAVHEEPTAQRDLTTLLASPAGERLALVLGHSWSSCPVNVLALSLPALAGALWALRGLAPTRPRAAGFSVPTRRR